MEREELFQTIDSLYEEYKQILLDVCNIESPTDYKEGVDRVGAYFADRAHSLGWKVEMHEESVAGNVVAITMNEIYKKIGLPTLTAKPRGDGSDAADVSSCGTPCVDSIGIHGSGLHTPSEYANLPSLKEAAKRIAAVVAYL